LIINKKKIRNRKLKKGKKRKENKLFLTSISSGKIPALIDNDVDLLPTSNVLRLSKVARKLNKSFREITDYLNNNGFEIELNPNSKLSIEQIQALNNSKTNKTIDDSRVIDYTWKLIDDLKLDYNIIFEITPEQFEKIVAEFLIQSGFTVRLNGKTNQKDGGIDIIAWKKEILTIVVAIQVKFKTFKDKKVTSSEVRDFKGSLAINDYFTAGMVVTNTDFTVDARWIEEQINSKLELKNYKDLKKWMNKNFTSSKEIILDLNLGKDINFKEKI